MWDRTEKTIFVVAFIFIALFTRDQLWNPNDMSRMGGVESIVERGTFSIDNSTFVNTIDKVKANGHLYSDKPAMSYLIAVPAYYILHRFFDLDFATNRNLTYYLITLFTIGLSTCIMLVYFYRLMKRHKLDNATCIFYTFALLFGTLLFPFSLIYNNHGLAAAWILICFYLVLNAKTPKQHFVTGLFSGFVSTIDLVSGNIFSVLFLVWFLLKDRRKTFYCFVGVLIPVAIALLINSAISGSIIPFNVNTQMFNFSGSAFGPGSLSGVVMQAWKEIPMYAYDLVLGQRGFFKFSPVLVFSLAGLIVGIFLKKWRNESILVLLGIIATFVFYITRTNNYGGCSYGLRWTVALIPILFYFTPIIIEEFKSQTMIKIAFVLTLVISAVFAFIGAMEPWTCSQGLFPEFMVNGLIDKLITILPDFK